MLSIWPHWYLVYTGFLMLAWAKECPIGHIRVAEGVDREVSYINYMASIY
jgi:hypothetical protein